MCEPFFRPTKPGASTEMACTSVYDRSISTTTLSVSHQEKPVVAGGRSRLCCILNGDNGEDVETTNLSSHYDPALTTSSTLHYFRRRCSPRTRSPGSMSRAWATRRMLWRLRLRWPRSTWPMNVQCSSDWSARASWDSPNCWRRVRTRAPNSPAAGEMGGLGEVVGT